VREKAAEFDAQIDKLKKEQGLRVKNRDKNREFNDSLQQQFREGVLFWRTAILMEYGLLETQFKKKNELEENGLAAVKNLLRQLQTQELKLVQNLDGRDPKALVRLQQNQEEQNLASEKIALMEKRIAARKRNYEDSRRVLENNRDREMNALTEAASEISGTQHYRMSAIPSVTVSFSGWTIAVSNEHAGARFKFNKVLTSGVDEKFDREGHYAETVAYIELFGKVRIFAGQRTDFTLEGVNTYSVGGISTGPKPNPDPFDDEKKPDESWKIELPRP
jgi:hypothetical protein